MPTFPPISVRQPRAFDLVDVPVQVCGVATGFEGVISARVRDANGNQLAITPVHAGGTGIWGNYDISIPLGGTPATHTGTVEVFEESAKGDGTELNKVVVPVAFGPALIDPYHGFQQYTIVPGDTLSSIAQGQYGDANLWPRIFDANRDEISNPNLIFAGQVLRIPV
jgi:nucleoid-associated protein YgaU